jgi:hypothetical protein
VLPHLTPEADADVAIGDMLRAYLDHIEEHPHLYRFIRAYDTTRDGSHDPVGRAKDLLATRIAAQAGREAADPTTRLLAAGVLGLCDGVIQDWLNDRLRVPREAVLQQLARMLRSLGGAAPPPPAPPEPRSSPEVGR